LSRKNALFLVGVTRAHSTGVQDIVPPDAPGVTPFAPPLNGLGHDFQQTHQKAEQSA